MSWRTTSSTGTLASREADRPIIEAEGTAYTVLSYFGVDASEYSFAYVARWAERK